MGYKYSFIDNETYGTDDINAALSRLTTSGVAIYPTDENLIPAMNSVTAEMTTEGVEYSIDACRVEDAGEGNIKILSGTAFFENGMSITIDDEGIILAKENDRNVYLCYNNETNTCYAELATGLPERNYVLLAQIDAEGEITDKRSYAVSRLAPNSPPKVITFTKDIDFRGIYVADYLMFTYNIGHQNYSHIGFRNNQWSCMGIDAFGDDGYTSRMNICGTRAPTMRFKKAGKNIEAYIQVNGDSQVIREMKFFVF